MADLFEAIYTKLGGESTITAIVGTSPKRIYPEVLPQGATLPAIVFRETSDEPTTHLNGVSGHGIARIEIGCLAETVAAARALRVVVHTVLDKYRGTSASFKIRDCVPTGDRMDEEPANNGSDVWRQAAVAEFEIGYQT